MPKLDRSEGHAVAVSWAPGFKNPAESFAHEHQLSIINDLPDCRGLCFHLGAGGWSLIDLSGEMPIPFSLNFEPRYVAQGKDPLLNAMGKSRTVLDMTAGWGSDAVHIALSGRKVISAERNPVVYQLLVQARSRLGDIELSQRLNFVHLDATGYGFTQTWSRQVGSEMEIDLVYLDPMFSEKQSKRAKSKKPMRLMQQLTEVPSDSNEQRLFENALSIARKRVVVKRALKAPFINDIKPQGSIRSKMLRFDLYLP
jgi:16S rRNA (guanine1516-N2)-methyltransferase